MSWIPVVEINAVLYCCLDEQFLELMQAQVQVEMPHKFNGPLRRGAVATKIPLGPQNGQEFQTFTEGQLRLRSTRYVLRTPYSV